MIQNVNVNRSDFEWIGVEIGFGGIEHTQKCFYFIYCLYIGIPTIQLTKVRIINRGENWVSFYHYKGSIKIGSELVRLGETPWGSEGLSITKKKLLELSWCSTYFTRFYHIKHNIIVYNAPTWPNDCIWLWLKSWGTSDTLYFSMTYSYIALMAIWLKG